MPTGNEPEDDASADERVDVAPREPARVGSPIAAWFNEHAAGDVTLALLPGGDVLRRFAFQPGDDPVAFAELVSVELVQYAAKKPGVEIRCELRCDGAPPFPCGALRMAG